MTPAQKRDELQLKLRDLLEDPLYLELFNARCHDTGDHASIENAKRFKEQLLKRNVKNSTSLNLTSMGLGINSMIALSNAVHMRQSIEKLNMADNDITQFGMHSVKNIITACGANLHYLNLASNKISCEGILLLLEELTTNQYLKHLDLGVFKTSQFRNDIGVQGAKALANFITRNRTLECLDINDCNLSPEGGEAIGMALAQNHSLKQLKISENDLCSEGAV